MFRFRIPFAIFFLFAFLGFSFASAQTFDFQSGWNTFSTPKVLSKIEYSNATWSGLTFFKYSNGAWSSTVANTGSIKPLEGFMVYNSNSSVVSTNLTYENNLSPSQMLFSKSLSAGWNVLGVTTTSNPFATIGGSATMSVDFTRTSGWNNRLNGVNGSFSSTTGNASVVNPQLGESYAVFIQTGALYAGSQNPADETAPTLVLKGDNPMYVELGGTFSDPGATWDDAENGTWTVFAFSGTVNPSVAGTYGLEYRYSDPTGNVSNLVTRSVIVVQPAPANATIAYSDAVNSEFLKDKRDLVLGKFIISNTNIRPLKLTAVNLTIESNTASGISNLLENVEIYDESLGTVYPLVSAWTSTGEIFYDRSLSIPLGTSKTFAIRADSKNVAYLAGQRIHIKLSNLGTSSNTAGLLIKEILNDNVATDISPSAISYSELVAATATATLTKLPLSSTKTAVVGARDVEALAFNIQAGSASALKLREVRVAKNAGTLGFTNTGITAVKLYKDSVSDANLVKQVGGSSIAADVVNFDSILVDIAKNQTQKFVVTVSIVDDLALNGLTLKLAVSALDLEDYDNDDITITGTAVSDRTITVTGVGTLAVIVDNTNSKSDKEKSVLAGTTSAEVAAVKLTATNEAVTAKDISVTLSGSNVANAVASVSLYKADGSLIASKTVTTATVLFEDVNYAVAEGSEAIYVKVLTNKVGKDQIGKDTVLEALVTVTDAEGVSSKKVITATNGSTYSKAFAISSVRVSAVAFVDSYAGVARATKLTSGANNLAILAVTADNTANTLSGSAEVLKTQIDALKLQIDQVVASGATSVTVEKIGGNGSTATLSVSGSTATGALSALGTDAEVAAGETVYFLVKGSITLDTGIAGNESAQVSLADLNDGAIVYSDNDIGAAITALRLSTTKLDGAKISD